MHACCATAPLTPCTRPPHFPHLQVVLVTNSGKPLLRGMGQPSASSSSDEEDDSPAAVRTAGNSTNVLPTAEPPVAATASVDGDGAAGQQEGQEPEEKPRPWSSPEEMETMARFGAYRCLMLACARLRSAPAVEQMSFAVGSH